MESTKRPSGRKGGLVDNNSSSSVSQEESGFMEASNISEYLMETLPGWHVDEFLDPYGYCKFSITFLI